MFDGAADALATGVVADRDGTDGPADAGAAALEGGTPPTIATGTAKSPPFWAVVPDDVAPDIPLPEVAADAVADPRVVAATTPASAGGFCVVDPGISAPQSIGVRVAVFESAMPRLLVARTQYVVVCVSGGVVKLVEVAPAIGFDVSPVVPRYH